MFPQAESQAYRPALPLILASTSIWRRALLERLALPFECGAPGVAEDPIAAEAPPHRAERLSLAKARAVAVQQPEAIVIGSDQVAAGPQGILHKPGSVEACRSQLASLSGASARFYTGCAVLSPKRSAPLLHVDVTTVRFRSLTAAEIERYVERDDPSQCAGGFRSESLGISLFENITCTDPTALVGLPLIWLAGALRECGLEVP